jgi:signal peptidase I
MSKRSRALRYYRSYKPQNPLSKLLRLLLKLIVILFLGYYLITGFLIRSYHVETVAGQPSVKPEDGLLATPLIFGPRIPFTGGELPPLRSPRRGELVVRRNPTSDETGLLVKIGDPVLRFFTLQQYSLRGTGAPGFSPRSSILRVIGLPGDTVRMWDFTVYIKPGGSGAFIAERELIGEQYPLRIPQEPSGGGSGVPAAGTHPPLTLGEGEYLLVPDNRRFAAAAAAWRPTGEEMIADKVLVRYWPEYTRF